MGATPQQAGAADCRSCSLQMRNRTATYFFEGGLLFLDPKTVEGRRVYLQYTMQLEEMAPVLRQLDKA